MAARDSASNLSQTVCSVAFIKRKPGLTQQEFYHHWENVHGPLVKPWAQKHGFISYTQVHFAEALNKGMVPIGPESRQKINVLGEFDGCAVFELPSFEVFAAAFEDEYYLQFIEPDEKKFIDKKAGVTRSRGNMKKIV